MPTEDDVLAANRRFYEAFEAGDIDAMSDVWVHDDDVVCTHPGWATLHGWAAISASWFALFHNDQSLQFIVTNERARVAGDVAWVSCDENILGDGPGRHGRRPQPLHADGRVVADGGPPRQPGRAAGLARRRATRPCASGGACTR